MRTFLRILATVVGAVATFYFALFFIGTILLSVHLPAWISTFVSIVVCIVAARFIWMQSGSPRPGLGRAIGIGALVTGAIAFSAGFFGPTIFTPGSNQGPLLGIFITGPLGLILGGVGGAIYWMVRRKRGRSTDDDRGVLRGEGDNR
jgi:hypothetical protein